MIVTKFFKNVKHKFGNPVKTSEVRIVEWMGNNKFIVLIIFLMIIKFQISRFFNPNPSFKFLNIKKMYLTTGMNFEMTATPDRGRNLSMPHKYNRIIGWSHF